MIFKGPKNGRAGAEPALSMKKEWQCTCFHLNRPEIEAQPAAHLTVQLAAPRGADPLCIFQAYLKSCI